MSKSKKTPVPETKKFSTKTALPGSERQVPPGKRMSSINPGEIIEITIKLRRKNSIEDYVGKMNSGNPVLSRNQFDEKFGASQSDIELVEEYAHQHDLTVVQSSVSRRLVILKGTIQNFSNAFDVHLSNYQHADGKIFRGRTGSLCIPEELKGIVEGIFGLDDRPQASPMFHIVKNDGHLLHPRAANSSYNPNEVGKAYHYPQDVNGKGQCVGLIELGGGFRSTDMATYFSKLGLTLPVIRSASVDGASNNPSTADSEDAEVVLDIQVAGAIAPGAKIIVYFAPNTDKGFLDAISTALHDSVNSPSVISISWGAAESQWSQQAMDNYNQTFMSAAALGVTISAAAGDHGSSDGQNDGKAHVDFPASSPYVLACGGTKLTSSDETVWNDGQGWATGGGISDNFPVPSYQTGIQLPQSVNSPAHTGRALPDIAGNADSSTGYNVFVDGQWAVIGGTSAVAPLMAGFIALANEKLGKLVGYINPKLYTIDGNSFKDIIKGDNITSPKGGYAAKQGYDACSGLGVPLGELINHL